MNLAEKLLLVLSRHPGSGDYDGGQTEWHLENSLSKLCRVFPDFLERIADKVILDFGCGTGWQAVGLARSGARWVIGVDTDRAALSKARALAADLNLSEKVRFVDSLQSCAPAKFDIVISQNSMEHFPSPEEALQWMQAILEQDGVIFITFGPPWLAPWGSHMHFFTTVPWLNILFGEATVMKVRARFRSDGATRYEEVESGLNKMTVTKFERLVEQSGLDVLYRRYDCVKGLNFLSRIPGLRELVINNVSCELGRR